VARSSQEEGGVFSNKTQEQFLLSLRKNEKFSMTAGGEHRRHNPSARANPASTFGKSFLFLIGYV
jgi:hypothetical protein